MSCLHMAFASATPARLAPSNRANASAAIARQARQQQADNSSVDRPSAAVPLQRWPLWSPWLLQDRSGQDPARNSIQLKLRHPAFSRSSLMFL